MKTKQHAWILQVMQLTDSPRRSRDINDAYANLNGWKHLLSISGRLSELHTNWYIDVITIYAKDCLNDPSLMGSWYILTESGRVPWVIPICNKKADWSEKYIRFSKEESIIKKENKELNCKLEVRKVPEIEPTTLLGKVRKFFLSFKS